MDGSKREPGSRSPRAQVARVLATVLLSVGCAHSDAAAPVVNLGGAGPVVAAGPMPPPPAPSGPMPDEELRAFVGTWEDRATSGHVNTRVEIVGGVPTVVSVKEVIGDLETYKLESTGFRRGELRWIYYVPSTQYRVVLTATKPANGVMPSSWSNDHDMSGTTDLVRVDAAAASGQR